MKTRLALAAFALGCARPTPDRIAPAPETHSAPSPPAPPTLQLTSATCQYGGTAPAFFVWAEATAVGGDITHLDAKSLTLRAPSGTWTSAVASTLAVRVRAGANGVGNVTPLAGPIVAGQTMHLEIFGPLALAPFGAKADYPTDDRPFRVELTSDQGSFVMTGTCVVGPAG